jgi:hypothetical protein
MDTGVLVTNVYSKIVCSQLRVGATITQSWTEEVVVINFSALKKARPAF